MIGLERLKQMFQLANKPIIPKRRPIVEINSFLPHRKITIPSFLEIYPHNIRII